MDTALICHLKGTVWRFSLKNKFVPLLCFDTNLYKQLVLLTMVSFAYSTKKDLSQL